jgi:RHS repeat-associated protein
MGIGSTSELVGLNYGSLEALESYANDAYGNLRITPTGPLLTSFLYSGEMTDAATGQQYLRARYYDPGTGRFNRLDPFAGNVEDPQSLHKYLYVHGDPIQGVDPTGNFEALVGTLQGLAIDAYIRGLEIAPKVTAIAYVTFNLSLFALVGSSIYVGLEETGIAPDSQGLAGRVQGASSFAMFVSAQLVSTLGSLPSVNARVRPGTTVVGKAVQQARIV